GVDYYNDSKATNVGSVVGGLAGFERPVVLIAGGKDKGGDYRPLAEAVSAHCRHVVLLGAAAELIAAALDDDTAVSRATTMDQAVAQARQAAQLGDAVVLAPACSSYDMYENYARRGDDFARAVNAL
ncbi:MAG: hypothetical protein KDB14_35160, partial [Planctomycetales bacterium]|nr:hypothetical protein [Planctomycetales bacterium]